DGVIAPRDDVIVPGQRRRVGDHRQRAVDRADAVAAERRSTNGRDDRIVASRTGRIRSRAVRHLDIVAVQYAGDGAREHWVRRAGRAEAAVGDDGQRRGRDVEGRDQL